MNKKLEKTCLWKKVANNDEIKRKSGIGEVTLSLDKPCYICNGTKKYAEKINCKAYHVLKNE